MVERAWDLGLEPSPAVYDCATLRASRRCPEPPPGYMVLRARNPAGTLTLELVEALAAAASHRRAAVLVDGEEDMAVLPLILLMPRGSLIIYGQPFLGVVSLEVDDLTRWQAIVLSSCLEAPGEGEELEGAGLRPPGRSLGARCARHEPGGRA